jgi:hypothetical protein
MCTAQLIFTDDPRQLRLLWGAACACGWQSAPGPDSRAALRAAASHDGLDASLLERRIEPRPGVWRRPG